MQTKENQTEVEDSSCVSTMKLIGDYWTLRIVGALRDGPARFCCLQRQLDNVNPVTLTKRLKSMEEADLISRAEETLDKISVVYGLTQRGQRILPIIKAIDDFSYHYPD